VNKYTLKVGLQTSIDLEIGKPIDIPLGCCDNITYVLSELMKRNSTPYIIRSGDIGLDGVNNPVAKALTFERGSDIHGDYRDLVVSGEQEIELNPSLDALFIRGDDIESNPELDRIYPLIDSSRVYIPADYFEVKAAKDKLHVAERFKDLDTPETLYAESFGDLCKGIDYLFKKGHRFVVLKYRFGFRAKGIDRVDRFDENAMEKAKAFFDKYKQVMVQEFDPIVNDGDIRIVMYDGEYVGAFERRPTKGQWITNIGLGGTSSGHKPVPGEKSLCKEIASEFPKIKLLGIDLLPSLKFIEVNGFCAGLTEIDELYGINIAEKLIDDVTEHKLSR